MQDSPLVTIGIPTYNRPDGLERTLNAMTRQSYKNLEIIVSDNASTMPEVQEVISRFTLQDSRVKSFRHSTNKGVWNNFNCLPDMGIGKYFMWAADDDLWEPFYVEGLVAELEQDPELILACYDSQYMLYNGTRLPYLPESAPYLGIEKNAHKRLLKVISTHSYNNLIYGLFRRKLLVGPSPLKVFESVKSGSALAPIRIAACGPYCILPKIAFYPTTYLEGYLKMADWLRQEVNLESLPLSDTDQGKIIEKSILFVFPHLYKKHVNSGKKSTAYQLAYKVISIFFTYQKVLFPASIAYHVIITAKDISLAILFLKKVRPYTKIVMLLRLLGCSIGSIGKSFLIVLSRLFASGHQSQVKAATDR